MRRVALLGVVLILVLIGWSVAVLGVRVNLTPSMPLGIYRMVTPQPHVVKRGMLVAVCAPLHESEAARRRRALLRGVCTSDTEPLLKMVVAVAGDEVLVTSAGIAVDGQTLPQSAPLTVDHAGRTLAAWPSGRYRMTSGFLWLYADHRRSWDSRYWGPVPVGNVLTVMEPVLVFR
jgi:conjugative transfer signal peptidase TraF